MGGRINLGRWALYAGCLAAALGTLGYYGLEYIPRQREYFLNLRFRALAVIGDQLRSKLTALGQSIEHAPKIDKEKFAPYLRAVVHDLTLTCDAEPQRLDLDTVRFEARQGCVPTVNLPKLLGRSVNDDLFDDVLIADERSRVLYQRAQSSPRFENLAELSKRSADPKAAFAEGNGADSDSLRMVKLAGSEYVLFLQPLSLSAVSGLEPRTFVLAGLARSDRLAREARHVAPKHLLLLFAPLVIVLLSGPFLKIALLTRTGRLAFRDMVLLAALTMCAASLATIVLLSGHDYVFAADRTQPRMPQFADALERDVVADLRLMRDTLAAFDEALPPDLSPQPARDRTDLWTDPSLSRIAAGYAPLDFVFWTNAAGCQAIKWSTKLTLTERVNQIPEQHFQSVRVLPLSGFSDEPFTPRDKRFALEARISSTTSQPIVLMDKPSRRDDSVFCRDPAGEAPLASVAMVGPIPSLDAALVPPHAGFAVFEPNGRVIFHSVPERNLHENLFEEILHPELWRDAIASRVERSGTAYYRGREYDFYMRPFRYLSGTTWNIAVFREMEPEQELIAAVWIGTLSWFLVLLGMIAGLLLLVSLVARARFRMRSQQQRDFILARVWPHPARTELYRSVARQLSLVAVFALAAEVFGARDPLGSAWWLLPLCFAVPAGTVLLIALRLWREGSSEWTEPGAPKRQPYYVACLALSVVLLATVPSAGLFRLCQAFETRAYVTSWQTDLASDYQARQIRRAADVRFSPVFSKGAKAFLLSAAAEPDGPGGRWARPGYLGAFWNTSIAPVSKTAEWQPGWADRLLGTPPSENVPAFGSPAPCVSLEGEPRQAILRCDGNSGMPVETASVVPTGSIPSNPLWWAVAVALLGVAYGWYCLACQLLFALDIRYTALPPLAKQDAAKQGAHLLVVGLPLSKKDEAVRNWLLPAKAPRVPLYAGHFHEYWLEETLARVEGELRPQAALAAAAPSNATALPDAPPRWVHVSNLEASLRDAADRRVVADLLEKLLTMKAGGQQVNVVVTSAVDPVFHFDSVIADGGTTRHENPLSELEIQRFARILHSFRKVTAEPDASPVHQAPVAPPDSTSESAEASRAKYKLYWSTCTRSEKLLLIQLAQTGFVNPHCVDTLEILMRKGLVAREPRPRIINDTFRDFLIGVEDPATVRSWECEAGESTWPAIRNMALVLVAVALGVLALTQNQAMQTLTAVVTGVGTVLAGILRLVGFLGGRRATPPPAS